MSDFAPRFATYRGLDEEGLYPALDGAMRFQDASGRYFEAYVRELGLDSRRLEGRGGRRGDWELRLGWQELPAWRGELKTQRKTLDLGASFKPGTRWRWDLDAQRSRKDGQRPFGAGVFIINASHFPVPVDYRTDRVRLAVSWNGQSASFDTGLYGSWFDNGIASVTWTNPFTPVAGTDQLRAALAPDNQAWQWRLGGSWRPTTSLRLSARAVFGRAEQDDALLPYTINPTVPERELPRPRLDARVDAATFNLAGKLAWRLGRGWDLAARLRIDDRDNRTPVDSWYPVITDLFERPATRNRPYDFRITDTSADLRYRAGNGLRFRLGGRYRGTERTLQAVTETDELEAWGEVDFSGLDNWRLRLKLLAGDRDASPYRVINDPGLAENPLMRKFHLADRERRQWVFEADFVPAARFDLALSVHLADDDYSNSPIGLAASDDLAVILDLNWPVHEQFAVHAFFSRQRLDATINGLADGSTAWRSDTRDTFDTAGLGLTSTGSGRLSWGLDWVVSRGRGEVHTRTAGEAPFPDLVTDLHNLRLRLDWRGTGDWDWRALIEHERYDSRDWQVDGLAPDGISGVLTLGPFDPEYRVTVVRLLGSYRF